MLNQMLVKCKYDDVKNYVGKNTKATYNGNRVTLYFRLVCDEYNLIENIDIIKNNKNVLVLDYIGSDFSPEYLGLTEIDEQAYIIRVVDLDGPLTDKYVEYIEKSIPIGVTPIIRLSDEFCDLELLYKLSQKFKRIRFCGGNLFCIDGCRIGCCGVDILKSNNIKFDNDAYYRSNPCNCALNVCDIKDLTNIEIIKSTEEWDSIETKKETNNSKQLLFSDLLSGFGGLS